MARLSRAAYRHDESQTMGPSIAEPGGLPPARAARRRSACNSCLVAALTVPFSRLWIDRSISRLRDDLASNWLRRDLDARADYKHAIDSGVYLCGVDTSRVGRRVPV